MGTNTVVPVWKPQGWTPLQAVQAYKRIHPTHASETISYAGRLDPMAEGVLLLLVGETNKQRKDYESMQKTYETEAIFGIATDSLDALGLITQTSTRLPDEKTIRDTITQFVGKQTQRYPAYSSKPVNGKPLFWWARNNKLQQINIPTKSIEIHALQLTCVSRETVSDLYTEVAARIARVDGDFRQDAILHTWTSFAKAHASQAVVRAALRVSCTSGTYIRQLVSDIGTRLTFPAFCLSIVRTHHDIHTKDMCIYFPN